MGVEEQTLWLKLNISVLPRITLYVSSTLVTSMTASVVKKLSFMYSLLDYSTGPVCS